MAGKSALSLVKYEQPYAAHLAAVSDVKHVIATENIYSATHTLLVAKDQQLDHTSIANLQHQTLEKLLDTQIEIDNCLSNQQIFQHIKAMISRTAGIMELHQRCKHAEKLQAICLSDSIPTALRVELTVLAERMPEEYLHSLFTAWASTVIALEMGLTQRDVQHAFICGLFHDIGILHLQGDFSNRLQLSTGDWRTLQNHVVVGSMLVKELGHYPDTVASGILEHHERLDQTGYPTRKPGKQLGTFGQIVGATDLLSKICHYELSDQTSQLSAALPYIKMHRGAFKQEIFNAIIRMLSRCEYHPDVINDPSETKQQALQINEKLVQMENSVSDIVELMPPLLTSPSCTSRALTAMGLSLLDTVHQSGLTMEQTYEVLESIDAATEIENLVEISAMQHEVLWLFKRFNWNIDDFLDENPEWEQRETLQALTTVLKRTLNSAWEIERANQADEFKVDARTE